jgi:hypothetical protein
MPVANLYSSSIFIKEPKFKLIAITLSHHSSAIEFWLQLSTEQPKIDQHHLETLGCSKG